MNWKKRISLLVAIVFMSQSLVGCGKQSPEPVSSMAEPSSEVSVASENKVSINESSEVESTVETEISEEVLEQPRGVLYFYHYPNNEETDAYEVINISFSNNNYTDDDLHKAFCYALNDETLPKFTFSAERGELTFDFLTALPENFPHYRSFYTTLTENPEIPYSPVSEAVKKIYFTENGKPHISDFTDESGLIKPMQTTLKTFTQEDYAKERLTWEYQLAIYNRNEELPFKVSAEDAKLASFISATGSLFREDYSNPNEFDNSILIARALDSTKGYALIYAVSQNQEPDFRYTLPVVENLSWEWCYAKEHLEKTAQYLFGDDITIIHEPEFQFSTILYNDFTGVYTRGGTGIYITYYPVIIDKKEDGDKIIVTATQVAYGLNQSSPEGPIEGWMIPDALGNNIMVEDEAQLLSTALEQGGRYTITLQKQSDGHYAIYSKTTVTK